MKTLKTYIAAPVALDWGTVLKFKNKLAAKGYDVKLWERDGRYSDDWLNSADAVIFLLPELNWRYEFHNLPIGLKRELNRAYAQSKKLFIGYKTQLGDYNVYEANFNLSANIISGIANTTGKLEKLLTKTSTNVEYGKSVHVNDGDFTKLWDAAMPKVNQINPCLEIELGNSQTLYIKTTKNPDLDRRLLLMLC
jgi:hypothetical protein